MGLELNRQLAAQSAQNLYGAQRQQQPGGVNPFTQVKGPQFGGTAKPVESAGTNPYSLGGVTSAFNAQGGAGRPLEGGMSFRGGQVGTNLQLFG